MKNKFLIAKMRVLRFFRLFYARLIEPLSDCPDKRRKEFVLNILLTGSLAFVFWCDLFLITNSAIKGDSYRGLSPLYSILMTAFFCSLLHLSRKGRVNVASACLLASLYAWTTYGALVWGPDVQALLILYITLIFISGILINSFGGFIMTAIVGITMIAIQYIHRLGILEVQSYWRAEPTHMRDIVHYIISFFIITVIAWLSNREHEKSLKRARQSEKALARERDMLEETVEERTRELRQLQADRMAELYQFAEFGKLSSGLFHDLVSPLSVMTIAMENLNNDVHPHMKHIKENLTLSLGASRRMERFMSAVRRQVRMADLKEIFSINSIIEDVLILFHHKALKANVSLNFSASKNIQLYQNPIKVQQVFSNLVSNAIDAYDGIERQAEYRQVEVSLTRDALLNNIHIEVKDSGKGISDVTLPNIFDSFFTTKAPEKGMGLGLYSTKRIIEKDLGGSVSVESKIGEGTTFTVIIPCSDTL